MEMYMQMKDLRLDGNVIDNGWIENLKYDSGKTNMNAVMILSEIVYWYRPVEIRDELTGASLGYRKKFKSDKLQKSYQSLGDRFGITKRQVKDACDFLKKKGLLTVEFRNLKYGDIAVNNVMFIEPVFEELKKITGIDRVYVEETAEAQDSVGYPTLERNMPSVSTEDTLQTNVTGVASKRKTNTKNTTEITTDILSEEEAPNGGLQEAVDLLELAKGSRVTPLEENRLKDALQSFDKEIVLKAIEIMGLRADKKNLLYVINTLNDWNRKGLDTIDKVFEHLQSHETKKEKAKANREGSLNKAADRKRQSSNGKKPIQNFEGRENDEAYYKALEDALTL